MKILKHFTNHEKKFFNVNDYSKIVSEAKYKTKH